MPQPIPFSAQAQCISVSVTSTASTSAALPNAGNTLRVVNSGGYIAYFSVGTGSQTATVPSGTAAATCTPVLPGEDASFTIPNSATLNFSAIADTGKTTTLLVQVGEGQ